MEISHNNRLQQLPSIITLKLPLWLKCIGWPLICFSALATLTLILTLMSNKANESISIGLFGFFYKGSASHIIPIGLVLLLDANTFAGYRLLCGKPNSVELCLYIAYFTLGVTLVGKLLYYSTNYIPFEPVLITIYIITLHSLKRRFYRKT